MSKEKEIKCEYPQWKAEQEMNAKVEEEKQKARVYKNRYNAAKSIIVIAAAVIIALAIFAVVNSKENTAAQATAAILTEYEKEFKAETGRDERIELAVEVEKTFKDVKMDDLPKENAEFLYTCRVIANNLDANEEGVITGGTEK